jgi:FdhD protein
MNSNYKVLKYESGQTKEIKDQISIEEPLEIIIKYKDNFLKIPYQSQ